MICGALASLLAHNQIRLLVSRHIHPSVRREDMKGDGPVFQLEIVHLAPSNAAALHLIGALIPDTESRRLELWGGRRGGGGAKWGALTMLMEASPSTGLCVCACVCVC